MGDATALKLPVAEGEWEAGKEPVTVGVPLPECVALALAPSPEKDTEGEGV